VEAWQGFGHRLLIGEACLRTLLDRARRNEQGHLEPDAPADVVEKSLGFEDYELAEKSTPAL